MAWISTFKTIELALDEYERMQSESQTLLATLITIADWDQVRNKLANEHREHLLDVIDAITTCARRAIQKYES